MARKDWLRGFFLFGATVSASFFVEPFFALGSWKWLFLSLFFLSLYSAEWWFPAFWKLALNLKIVALLFAAIAVAGSAWLFAKWFPGVVPEPGPQATVELGMEQATKPIFKMGNRSAAVANQPSYQLFLNLLRAGERPHNLMIPVKSRAGDFILPGRALGPWAIETVSKAWKEPQPGDLILGIGKSWCLNCSRAHVYWVEVYAGREPALFDIAAANERTAEALYMDVLRAQSPQDYWRIIRDKALALGDGRTY